MVTNDVLASLLAHAWPQLLIPVNAMNGFKCRIYPLHPGEISDRQLHVAPSRAFVHSARNSDPVKLLFTQEEEVLYQTRFEEGYDSHDPKYSEWLTLNHLDVSDSVSTTESTHDPTVVSSSVTSSPSIVSTCAPDLPARVFQHLLLMPQSREFVADASTPG